MSAFGMELTFCGAAPMSAFEGNADIALITISLRYCGQFGCQIALYGASHLLAVARLVGVSSHRR